MAPRFAALQAAMDAGRAWLRTDASGVAPEQIVVLATAGPVEQFLAAVSKIPGLEGLAEIEQEDIPPDDDFFLTDKKGGRKEGALRGRLFLVLANQRALDEVLRLWRIWNAGQALPYGLKPFAAAFEFLRDVRPWGVEDRLIETGVLEDWQERVAQGQEVVPCEIELWFRSDPRRRRAGGERVAGIVDRLGGRILDQAMIEGIAYHALLAELPAAAIQPLLEEAGRDTELVRCEQVQYFRASGQMAGLVVGSERGEDLSPPQVSGPLGEPVVALFDGMPLQNHRRLAGRLVVDDPDGIEAQYAAGERVHGTAMASLILHGDLDRNEAPLGRRLYVRPILQPDDRMWRSPRPEAVTESILVVDLVHRAVRRLFASAGGEAPVAPQVCVINLSIGIRDRPFDNALSPLARLLDLLAWEHRLLFIVSAGNHSHSIELPMSRTEMRQLMLKPSELEAAVVRAVAADARHRRLLSPAEAVNAVTIGAVHQDHSTAEILADVHLPFVGQELPSVVNAQGMGYRRGIKPDVLLPGGRVTVRESLGATSRARLELVHRTRPPGQCVAAPGATAGDLSATCHIQGTSNAAALASRGAAELYDLLDELRTHPRGELIDEVPRAVWLKALLVHGAAWGSAGELLADLLASPERPRMGEYLTRLLGNGAVDFSRVREGTRCRVTVLGGGSLTADEAHTHRFPLPPALSGRIGWRRLILTLAWLTPVNPVHLGWRRASLWFSPPKQHLALDKRQAEWRAVQRGTVQHEVLEGERAAAFVEGAELEILVSCRADAGALESSVPYALSMTLEVAEAIGIDIYDEVRARVLASRVQVASESS